MNENAYLWYALAAGILALAYGVFLIVKILKAPQGSGKMVEIAKAIQDGAKAYLTRQYKTVGVVAVVVIVLMLIGRFSANTIYGFLLGAILSAIAGNFDRRLAVEFQIKQRA